MKILQINCVYPVGSTGRIADDIHRAAQAAGHTSLICYGRGDAPTEAGVYKTCPEWYAKANNLWARISGMPYGGCYFSTNRLISILKKEQPDVVHLHCINGYFVNIYRLVAWLRDHHIKTVLTLHAEFMYTANCAYAYECENWITGCGACPRRREATNSWFFDRTARSFEKMRRAFADFRELMVVSVSPFVAERTVRSPIMAGLTHRTILNGIDTTAFSPREDADLRKELQIPQDHRILLHITAEFTRARGHIKGGYYVAEVARRLSCEGVTVLVAGDYLPGERDGEGLRLLGAISKKEKLAALYTLADATLLASKKETFSMPVAESLCCGTPVVGFRAGAPERIALPAYSRFVPYGDTDALVAAAKDMLNTSWDTHACREQAITHYDATRMAGAYLDLYGELYERTFR